MHGVLFAGRSLERETSTRPQASGADLNRGGADASHVTYKGRIRLLSDYDSFVAHMNEWILNRSRRNPPPKFPPTFLQGVRSKAVIHQTEGHDDDAVSTMTDRNRINVSSFRHLL